MLDLIRHTSATPTATNSNSNPAISNATPPDDSPSPVLPPPPFPALPPVLLLLLSRDEELLVDLCCAVCICTEGTPEPEGTSSTAAEAVGAGAVSSGLGGARKLYRNGPPLPPRGLGPGAVRSALGEWHGPGERGIYSYTTPVCIYVYIYIYLKRFAQSAGPGF